MRAFGLSTQPVPVTASPLQRAITAAQIARVYNTDVPIVPPQIARELQILRAVNRALEKERNAR